MLKGAEMRGIKLLTLDLRTASRAFTACVLITAPFPYATCGMVLQNDVFPDAVGRGGIVETDRQRAHARLHALPPRLSLALLQGQYILSADVEPQGIM